MLASNYSYVNVVYSLQNYMLILILGSVIVCHK